MDALDTLRDAVTRYVSSKRLGTQLLGSYPGDFVKSGPGSFHTARIYFCGLNPGGAAAGKTLLDQIAELGRSPSQWYEHERKMPFGRRLEKLFGPGFVDFFFTNLIFLPSSSQAELCRAQGIDWSSAVDACWPIHELFLSLIQPEIIIACGNDAFHGIARKLEVAEPTVDIRRIDGTQRFFRKVRTADGGILLGIPHLSWFHPNAALKDLLVAEGVPVSHE